MGQPQHANLKVFPAPATPLCGRHRPLSHYYMLLLLLAGCLLLTACSSGSYAPVSDRSISERQARIIDTPNTQYRIPAHARPSQYVVQRGDTLYTIAFRYGIDFKTLARANNIDSSYRIYPGQRLSLKEPSPRLIQKSSSNVKKQQRAVTKSQSARPITKSAPKKASSATPQNAGPISWGWPAKGQVVKGYSASGSINKGINIAAAMGDPVFAAAKGQVVYAGSGLLGYGNLVIIKHDSRYLSAYAHNSKLLVKEHDSVTKGEKIAEAGNSGSTRVMLHFEIRKDGNPVNPLNYLPR